MKHSTKDKRLGIPSYFTLDVLIEPEPFNQAITKDASPKERKYFQAYHVANEYFQRNRRKGTLFALREDGSILQVRDYPKHAEHKQAKIILNEKTIDGLLWYGKHFTGLSWLWQNLNFHDSNTYYKITVRHEDEKDREWEIKGKGKFFLISPSKGASAPRVSSPSPLAPSISVAPISNPQKTPDSLMSQNP